MNNSFKILSDVIQLLWPLIAVFTLIVSLRAKQQHPGQGSTLMVVGGALSLFVSAAQLVRNYGLRYGWFEYADIKVFFDLTVFISLVGQVLFLIGLLILVNSIITVEEKPMNRSQ